MRCFGPLMLLLFTACRSEESVKTFNTEPTATITSHADGAELLAQEAVTFIGAVSDANNEFAELTTTWRTDLREICLGVIPDAGGNTSCVASLEEGESELFLQVEDPNGATGVAQINVTVLPTSAPTAEIISPLASGIYYSDQKITFEGLVADTEDAAESLGVTWDSDIDGVLEVANTPNEAGEVDGATYLSQGEHYLRLTATDATDKTGTDNVTIIEHIREWILRGLDTQVPRLRNEMVRHCCSQAVFNQFIGAAEMGEEARGALAYAAVRALHLNRYVWTLSNDSPLQACHC